MLVLRNFAKSRQSLTFSVMSSSGLKCMCCMILVHGPTELGCYSQVSKLVQWLGAQTFPDWPPAVLRVAGVSTGSGSGAVELLPSPFDSATVERSCSKHLHKRLLPPQIPDCTPRFPIGPPAYIGTIDII